jgi:outer membrane protein assembly factor BamA
MRHVAAFLALVLVSGCTYPVSRGSLPPPLTNESFAEKVKVVSIPLPVIASSPNEGITSGGLIAFLLHNKKDEVSTLVVPQVNYNEHFGTTGILYGAFYPEPGRNWKINLAKATRVNKEYRIRYGDEAFLSPRLEMNFTAFDFTDGSARFFGFESQSSRQNETNYADVEKGFGAGLGYRFDGNLELLFGERYKKVDIGRGAVTEVPFITDRFPAGSVPGVNGFHVHAQSLSLVHNTLDSTDLPTKGAYARLSLDNSFRDLGANADYRIFSAETKLYLPGGGARYITVGRLALSQASGHNIPFLEQSILGGETTLRGYGQNRFVDKSYLLLNLEERIRLFRWELFDVLADWEIAPFMDFGSVMRSLLKSKAATFEFNPGVGLRTVVRPNIIGRIDVGVGGEGPAVFVGLGYPF